MSQFNMWNVYVVLPGFRNPGTPKTSGVFG